MNVKDNLVEVSLARLLHLCGTIPPLLQQIGEKEMSHIPAPGKWSKKQILGHLIDSAANNHRRLVCGQFEDRPLVAYDQNLWNRHSYHQELPAGQLITFWQLFNIQIHALVKNIPAGLLSREVRTGEKGDHAVMSLDAVFKDYVVHLEHHLRQLTNYA